MTRHVIELDAKHFFPGQWEHMTKEEQERWRAAIADARRRSNTGVTHKQQNFLQPTPRGGNRGNRGTKQGQKEPHTTGGQMPTIVKE
jgi:hypothetical protein